MSEGTSTRQRPENSSLRFGASIDALPSWVPLLARACHDASRVSMRGALDTVLGHLREAAGAERALLLEAPVPTGHARVIAASVSRSDETLAFSTSIAARALRGRRPMFFPDVRREPVWAEGLSLRSLALRSVVAAPVPAHDGRQAAIVLDSRLPLSLDAETVCVLTQAFAGLISLIRRAAPSAEEVGAKAKGRPVGRSSAFLNLQDEVRSAARVRVPVLVVGESGSGKELVARALHDGGPHARRPFIAINCAAIPETLLERELFGATRGSFTGADRDHPGLFRHADGGTVFLDEIGDMPLPLQAKLLRVLQEGTVRAVGALEERAVDVRVIAATHRDLELLVAENRFRADLRWRLEVLVLRVPALRERAEDLPVLCDHLIARLASRYGLERAKPDAQASARLAAHSWPGNVRELESVLARALLRQRDGVIRADDLDIRSSPDEEAGARAGKSLQGLERAMIEDALRVTRGNVTAAALRIGWSRQALYRRIHALGLSEVRGTKSSQSSTFQ